MESASAPRNVIDRTLGLLELVAEAEQPLDLENLVDQAGLPRTTCHRILQTLLKWGLVEQNGDYRYELGTRILQLSAKFLDGSSERVNYRPLLSSARDLSEETTCLVVKREASRICIDFVASRHSIAYNPKLGETLPISVGASGRAFLSSIEPRDAREAAIAALYHNLNSASVSAMLERTEKERGQGYFTSFLDRPGMNGVAIPLRDVNGTVVATISIVGPSDRWTIPKIDEIAPKIVASVRDNHKANYSPSRIIQKKQESGL